MVNCTYFIYFHVYDVGGYGDKVAYNKKDDDGQGNVAECLVHTTVWHIVRALQLLCSYWHQHGD